MVSKNEVLFAYRFLLGRDPESEDVINHYATEVADWRALRTLFFDSPEFRTVAANAQSARPASPPFTGPAMKVELDGSEADLARLFAKTALQWQHLGETEPHWSVLTNESYFQENFHMNKAAFFASGQSEAKMFEAVLTRAGVARDGLRTCLELGCGVGRVTAALATRFPRVIGVDISKAHLQFADEYLQSQGITNVECRQLTSIEGIADFGVYDVLYSRIVLQHNSPPVMARMLRDLLKRLSSGGVAFIQIPTYKAGYNFRIDSYLQHQNTTHMEMHFFPQAALLKLIAEQGCRVLEIREDDAIGLSVTSISNTLLLQKS